jgi:flavin-binding protein dodecin
MAVINTLELEGVSDKSWGEAAREALREAARTIRNIRKMDIVGTRATVDENQITEYRTEVRVFFEVEKSR